MANPPLAAHALATNLWLRLHTPRGSLADRPDEGFDLRGFVGRLGDVNVLRFDERNVVVGMHVSPGLDVRRFVVGNVIAECERDPGVKGVAVELAPTFDGFAVRIEVTPTDPSIPRFAFRLDVDADHVRTTWLGALGPESPQPKDSQ